MRPVEIVKRGTIVWSDDRARSPCPPQLPQEIIEAIVSALAAACERTMAAWGKRLRIAINGATAHRRGVHLAHVPRPPGRGPRPAVTAGHGRWHAAGGLKFGSVEVAEARFPLHFAGTSSGRTRRRRALRGRRRRRSRARRRDRRAVQVNTAGDGARLGPIGMLGGEAGEPPATRARPARARGPRLQARGDRGAAVLVLEIHAAGGGGWGDPASATWRRRRDRRDGRYAARAAG